MVSRRTFLKQMGLATAGAALALSGCSKDDKVANTTPPVQTTPAEADESDPDDPNALWGIISDTDGNLLSGVVVSDGYSCTVTDAGGRYELVPDSNAIHIYFTIPAAYEVPMANGRPYFWRSITSGTKRYDFSLTPLSGGVETKFNLFCIADPQCQTTTHLKNFDQLYVPDLKAEADYQSAKLPTYGIVLGDVVWNNATNYVNNDILPDMNTRITQSNLGMPYFILIGNHDHSYKDNDDIDAQRDFEKVFGPINYSFDRGNVHFVVMDDCLFDSATSYDTAFRDDQVEWLRQELSYMPSNKLLIFCTHSPLRNRTTPNVQNVLKVLDEHKGYHIMSAHIHTTTNYDTYSTHYEHNHGALCGAFWRKGRVCADGTPNGYGVYTINGTSISNWYYKTAEHDRDFQIRLYHGEDWFFEGYNNKYQFAHNNETSLIADVWNADGDWTVELYQNGTKLGNMKRFTGRDAWASGYFMGPAGRSTGGDYDKSNVDHLYYYELSTPTKETSGLEVRATDRFGTVYTQSTIISNTEADMPIDYLS